MNKERRVGRRSVVQNLVKLTPPELVDEDKISRGPKKALFNDDTSFVMRRPLKPLHEINNFQYSSIKSKSDEKLYEENSYEVSKSTFVDVFNKHNRIPLSPPSRIGILESSSVKNRKELSEPVLQSKDLFNTLIDSPCTKYGKLQYSNALSSASKFLLNRHLESVTQHPDIFKEVAPELNLHQTNEKHFNEFKTPQLVDLSITPKQNVCQSDCQTQTSSIPLFIEEIEELKKNEIEDIRRTKLHCCNLIKNRFNEIELEIEKHFGNMENKVTENYDKLLKKIHDGKNESADSQVLDTTVVPMKEKNYTRMTGTYGIFNNLKADCSFLKTPKSKTRKEMLTQGVLTPCTMSFVCQEQLMHLNSNT